MQLYEALAAKVTEWRKQNYPHDEYPAIGEILEWAHEPNVPVFRLRGPQLRALETYWYLRLVEKTPHIFDLYTRLFERTTERLDALGMTHPDMRDLALDIGFDGLIAKVQEDDAFVKKYKLEALRETLTLAYPSYILALAMGAGKTVLIGAIFASEFAMAQEYPDNGFVENALIFAPGKTIIESLRELAEMQYEAVLPPRMYKSFAATLKLTFTRDGGQQMDFFAIMDENAERITSQNTRKISVIIGNPPYNANQLNENENNKNRDHPQIDQRIKDTYIKHSTAQKTKLYDMYTRFYRWASDRLDKNGILAFITNNSYLDSLGYDGFRKVVGDEFSHIYILDLGGDVRKNRKLSGTTHNVFGIQVGVAIAFMVKSDKNGKTPVQIFYARRPEFELATEKLAFLRTVNFQDVRFEYIRPDKKHNWLNISDNDWDDLMPIALKESKTGKKTSGPKSIFNLFSTGISTNRDEWVIDLSKENLTEKMAHFVRLYEDALSKNKNDFDTSIKWSRNLKQRFERGAQEEFDPSRIASFAYRPYCKHYLYYSAVFIDENGLMENIFEPGRNIVLCFTNPGSQKPFMSLSCNQILDLHLAGAGAGTQCLPLYRYAEDGGRAENITDWAFKQFQKQYKGKRKTSKVSETSEVSGRKITKEDIFHYVYAVLHHPTYRAKYEINLKREFPRIPFYEDFWQWANWGMRLMDLHLNYETVEPYPLERVEIDPERTRKAYKATLTAREESGVIEVDTYTKLDGVPAEAWEYQLGTYSALGWVLERYKEKKPRDPTIREKFNTYRFADYKEQVIDLLRRVCTVSVETMKIVKEMPQ